MYKTTYHISQMDCPSEEGLIRMKLSSIEHIIKLDFDIPSRKLFVYHQSSNHEISKALESLKLGCKEVSVEESKDEIIHENSKESRALWLVLAINFVFFLVEITTGIIGKSMGLVADSLDMLADSFVYGISLMAVGATLSRKKQIAKMAGYFQIILATFGLIEILRRFFGFESLPDFKIMMVISLFALLANAISLLILQKSKSQEIHMQASMIFTSNDILINLGVILAGALVFWTNSAWPDLVVGLVIFAIVMRGAYRILQLGK